MVEPAIIVAVTSAIISVLTILERAITRLKVQECETCCVKFKLAKGSARASLDLPPGASTKVEQEVSPEQMRVLIDTIRAASPQRSITLGEVQARAASYTGLPPRPSSIGTPSQRDSPRAKRDSRFQP